MMRIQKHILCARTNKATLGAGASRGGEPRASRKAISRLAVATIAASATLSFAATAHASHHSTNVSVSPGETKTLNLACPPFVGKVISGGAVTATPNLRVYRSFPLTDDITWSVSATNLDANVQTLWVSIICANFPSYDMRSTGHLTPSGAVRESVATCTSGQAMGGGFITDNPYVPIIGSRIEGNNWRVRAYNGSTASSYVTSFVTCSSSLGVRYDEPILNTTIAAGGAAFPTRKCTTGSGIMLSGGFWSNIDHGWPIVTGSLPNMDPTGNVIWKWNFRNWDSISHTYERTISCI